MKNSRGFVLITSYLVISILSVFSLALFARGFVFSDAAERNANKIIAFNMAEAALDDAMVELRNNPVYAGTGGYVSMDSATFQGGYEVNVITPPGSISPNIRQITATGHAPVDPVANPNYRAYETRSSVAYVRIQPSNPFLFSIFADGSIQINGEPNVDSYDSRNGPYGGANQDQNGDIGTNSTQNGDLFVNGNAVVNGDAVVGPGGNPADVIQTTNGAVITGTQTAAVDPRYLPPAQSTTASSGPLVVSGGTNQILTTGTYHYDSIQVTGNGQITTVGPVTIYVDGPVNIGGKGVATAGDLPPNFQLFVTTSDTVKISGNGDFYGAVYAPRSDVQNTGNGEIYGAVIANTYHQTGNGNIHYDEALSAIKGDDDYLVILLSWRELNSSLTS